MQAHKEVGAAVEKLLPKDLNPKIREQIEAATKPPGSPPLPADQRKVAPDSTAKSDRQYVAEGAFSGEGSDRLDSPLAAASPTKAAGTALLLQTDACQYSLTPPMCTREFG